MLDYPQPQTQVVHQPLPPPMPAPIPAGPGEDFFRFRIDGSDILEDLKHQLKGEVWDAQKGYYKLFDAWINDHGVNDVLYICYSCGINKNIILGNLTSDQIMYKCRMIKRHLALLFFKKYKDYGVEKERRSLLITTIVNQIHSALSRSEGGKESDQISVAAQRYEVFQHQEQQQQSGGIGSRLPFFGKKLFGGGR